jgi:hypothetical protein
MIAANNGYLLAFDNLSGLPNWVSDASANSRPGAVSPSGNFTRTMRRCLAGRIFLCSTNEMRASNENQCLQ